MSRLEVADLVVIAARTLELEPADALELVDLEAAEAALADARRGNGSVPRQISLSSASEMAAQMCRTGARGWLSSGSGVAQPPRCW
jgi:hypothetical protein